jgi:predicted nucleic acid-binding protein
MKRTAANAESIYADASSVLKLYLHEPDSQAMTAWCARLRGSLAVTLFGRVEIVNAIGLALARGFLSRPAHEAALAALDDDFMQGRLMLANIQWRSALRLADEIGRKRTPALACRTLDILHVASALTLDCRHFLTFDIRQRKLAEATGLKSVVVA